MTYIARTIGLTKTYGAIEAVSDVSMNIRQGEIYGLLGHNRSGKTTLMRMLVNLVKPNKGEIELFGEKLSPSTYEILKRIGSIIEYPLFYDDLTAWDNMDIHCEYMGFSDKKVIGTMMEQVGLKDIGRMPVGEFSFGMRQRLGIARAMITTPELLILDEPINGLDPAGIMELRDLFKRLSSEHRITLLISSHHLGEIEQIADTVGVIQGGRLIEEVAMERIREQHHEYIELCPTDIRKAVYVIEHLLGLSNYKLVNEQTIRIYDQDVRPSILIADLVRHDVAIESFFKRVHSLEEYFMNLMKGDRNFV
ncbi:ABC transporter ATP-binding protein [Paenibacillus sp. JX-17]|uniref:ABC transporter ATP-binding protein n=1 Tax=Paenibacillus lacisoli TaxID=3064525 RepID=A0ABT9C6C6_9BACL|nr:ABC transporter ATP-binding protein [Paenibacillus sp. JX-17]MDO7904806.1 ABC transporter ATP-binding protein [Paenibacillus sp. JX-17]